jgi:hypothetical protein
MWVAVLLAFILLHRASILLFGEVSFERAFATELLMAGVLSLYATAAMARAFWPATAIAFVGYAASLIWPHLAPHVFAASLILMLVVAAQVWGRVSPQTSASESH